MKPALAAFLLFAFVAAAVAQPEVQRSHIEANVPPADVAENYLRRDLLAYFHRSGSSSITAIEYIPLRLGPTQSGTSYPKFYFWVKALSGEQVQQEGAARVAAVERTHFEVTDFLSRHAIQTNPSQVGKVFPAALVQPVLERAAAK